jgi:hypothetical protein
MMGIFFCGSCLSAVFSFIGGRAATFIFNATGIQ